jgi:hypothetical protein
MEKGTLVTPADGKILTHFSFFFCRRSQFKESVAKYRRKCQRIPKEKLIFLDGTGMKAGARPTHGLAPKGKKAKIKSDKPEKYQPRVDMWGAISYNKPLDFDTKTSEERKEEGVRGYSKKFLKIFLRKKVAPKISSMRTNVIINMDRGFHCKSGELIDELKAGGAENVEDV